MLLVNALCRSGLGTPRIPASIPTQYRHTFTVDSWLQYRRSQSFSGFGPAREFRDEYRSYTDTGIERCCWFLVGGPGTYCRAPLFGLFRRSFHTASMPPRKVESNKP